MMWVLLFAGLTWLAMAAALVMSGKLPWLQERNSSLIVALAGPITASLIIYAAYSDPSSTGGPLVGKTRITVTSVGVRLQPGQSLLIGGDKSADAVIVRNAPAGLIRLWAEPDLPQATACSGSVASPASPQPGGPGTRLCAAIARIGLPEAVVVEVDEVPHGLVPLPEISVCDGGCGRGGGALQAPEEQHLYLPGVVAAARPGDAFYWVDGSGRAFARSARNGAAAGVQIRDDARIAVLVAAPLLEGEQSAELTLAQAWTVSWRAGALRLRPERPEILLSDPGPVALATAAEGGRIAGDGNVRLLRSIGRDFAGLLALAELILPSAAVDQTYVKSGSTTLQNNDNVELASAGRSLALRIEPLTLDEGLPGHAGNFAILFLVAGAALTWRLRRDWAWAAMLLALVETLLALRILIAVEGGMVDDTVRAFNALPSALVALPLGTLVVALALARSGQMIRLVIGFTTLAALALALVAELRGGIAPLVHNQTLILLGLAAVPPIARLAAMAAARCWKRVDPVARRLGASLPSRIRGAWYSAWPVAALTLGAAGVIVLLRLLVRPLGKEHVYVGDTRLAFSIFFVPLTIIAIAPLFSRIARARSASDLFVGFAAFALFLVLGILVPNVGIAKDSGAALVLMAAATIAAAAAVMARASPRPGTSAIWAAAAAAISAFALAGWGRGEANWWLYPLLAFIGLAVLAFLALRGAPARTKEAVASALWLWPATALGAVLIMIAANGGPALDLPRPLASGAPPGTAYTRLIAVVAPSRFAEIMSRDAVRIRATEVHLRDYSATSDGRGFLNLPPPTELRAQQFTDYAAAVHLISPFGRWGVAGLILMLGSVAMLACAIAVAAGTVRAWTGATAMITLSGTSTYIILGNALAVPFTGRNVYLLAPTSTADLIEAMLLLALAGGLIPRSATT